METLCTFHSILLWTWCKQTNKKRCVNKNFLNSEETISQEGSTQISSSQGPEFGVTYLLQKNFQLSLKIRDNSLNPQFCLKLFLSSPKRGNWHHLATKEVLCSSHLLFNYFFNTISFSSGRKVPWLNDGSLSLQSYALFSSVRTIPSKRSGSQVTSY